MTVIHVQVKLWRIPDEGLTENLTQWFTELMGHSKKVSYIEWHPSASNVLLSASADLQVKMRYLANECLVLGIGILS